MALLGSSDNQVGILIKSDADLKGIHDADRGLGGLQKSSGSSGRAIGLLGGAAKIAAVGIAAAGAAIGVAGGMAIKSAGEYEQSRIAFETMLGSADKARNLMTEIAEFAKTTPFELPEVVAGTKQLLAFGFAQKELLPTMTKIGDLASGLGVPVGQLTNVFGQVKVAGRLMGQDLLQFTNAGVPMIAALAATMKKPQSEIKKLVEQGKVGFPEVEAALNHLTGEGSKFGGMMQKQSKSFNGVVSNIKDGFGQILRNAVGITVAGDIVQGGLFDRIKNAAMAVLPLVAKMAENVGPAMMRMFELIGQGSQRVVSAMQSLWNIIGPVIMPSLKALANTVMTQLWPSLKRLWDIIQPQLIPVLKFLGIVIGGTLLAAIWVAINVINVIIKVIGWLINVAIELGQRIAWVVNFIISYIKLLYRIWSTIFKALYAVGKAIFQAIYLAWAVVISLILAVVRPIASRLAAPFRTARDWIVSAFNSVRGFFGGIGSKIGSALANVYGKITSPFARAYEWIRGLPGRIAGAIGNVGQVVRDKLGDWDIPGPLGKVRDVIPGFATGGFTGRGGVNEVAGVVHRGEYVIPKSQVDQSSGLPKMGSSRQVTIHNLNVYPQSAAATREIFNQLDSDTLLTSKGFTPVRGGA